MTGGPSVKPRKLRQDGPMLKALRADLAIIKERDPAARGTLEILKLGVNPLELEIRSLLQARSIGLSKCI